MRRANKSRFNLVFYGGNLKEQWADGNWPCEVFFKSPEETEAFLLRDRCVKAHRVRNGQNWAQTKGIWIYMEDWCLWRGGWSKKGFKLKGLLCPSAVLVARFSQLCFLFFICPCTALPVVMVLLWKTELWQLSETSSFELPSVTTVQMHNETELWHIS